MLNLKMRLIENTFNISPLRGLCYPQSFFFYKYCLGSAADVLLQSSQIFVASGLIHKESSGGAEYFPFTHQ
jgi:hypothetical protein